MSSSFYDDKNPFIHLHLHTEYSLLDGFTKIAALAKHCEATKTKAVAMTDHGNLFGYYPFVKAMNAVGVKPIIGCEIYLDPPSGAVNDSFVTDDPDNMDDSGKGAGPNKGKRAKLNHMTLLAKNEAGWRNLCRLVSQSWRPEDFHYKPVVKEKSLEVSTEGVICLSGCMTGRLSRAILSGDIPLAYKQADYFYSLFGKENFFIEVHNHGMPWQIDLNIELVKIAKYLNVPIVAANDVHYLKKSDAPTQDALVAINMGKLISDTTRLSFRDCPELYYKSREEMRVMFHGIEEALDGPEIVAERCEFVLDTSGLHYPLMHGNTAAQSKIQLREMATSALTSGVRAENSAENMARLEKELDIIESSEFSDYFLIVSDLRNAAIEKGIPVGTARGSVAGSLLAYVIGITDVNPMLHDLLFERFLNPERISPPDIDLDFCNERRDEIWDYLQETYGADRTAHVLTVPTYGAKGALRAAGRALGVSIPEVSRLCSFVSDIEGDATAYYASIPKLMDECAKSLAAVEVVTLASEIAGLPFGVGVHASAIVITPTKTTDFLPVGTAKDGKRVLMATMDAVTDSGFLKLDILALRTASIVAAATDMVNAQKIKRGDTSTLLDISNISPTDEKTAEIYAKRNSENVFQIDDATTQNFCEKLPVTCLNDFVLATALCRPGPMGFISTMLDRAHGVAPVTPLHPCAPEIGADTYGILIYQEQVMLASRKLAGFSLGTADIMRKAMGKKDAKKMASLRIEFINGCLQTNNIPESESAPIFDILADFASYGFNKSHAVAYAKISWQTAYLKAHHPAEFFAASLHGCMQKKIQSLLLDAKNNGVSCLPPDINTSIKKFSAIDNKVFFGLAGIKGLTEKAIDVILEHRPYSSFFDFCAKTLSFKVGAGDIKSLVSAGAFDAFHDRGNLLRYIENKTTQTLRAASKPVQAEDDNLFFFATETTNPAPVISDDPSFKLTPTEQFVIEQEYVGFSFCKNPLTDFLGFRSLLKATPISTTKEGACCLLALIENKAVKQSASGKVRGTGVISDETGSIPFVCWPPRHKYTGEVSPAFDGMSVGCVYKITGVVDGSGQLSILSVDQVTPPNVPVLGYSICLDRTLMCEESLLKLHKLTLSQDGRPFRLAYYDYGDDGKKFFYPVIIPNKKFTLVQDYEVFREIMSIQGVNEIAAKLDSSGTKSAA